MIGGNVGVKHDRLTEHNGVNHSLAVHTHGNSLAQADITERAKAITIGVPASKAGAGQRGDIEVSVFPNRTGDEGRVDLASGLELEQQFALVIQVGGLVNDIAFAGKDRGDVGIGVLTHDAVDQVLELGQAFIGTEVVGVLVQADMIAFDPFIDDIGALANIQAFSIDSFDQLSSGVLTPDMFWRWAVEVDEVGGILVAGQAGPHNGDIIQRFVGSGALDGVLTGGGVGISLQVEGINRVSGGQGGAIRPQQAFQHHKGGRQLVHLKLAAFISNGAVRAGAASRADHLGRISSGIQDDHFTGVIHNGVTFGYGHRPKSGIAIGQAGEFLKDHRLDRRRCWRSMGPS